MFEPFDIKCKNKHNQNAPVCPSLSCTNSHNERWYLKMLFLVGLTHWTHTGGRFGQLELLSLTSVLKFQRSSGGVECIDYIEHIVMSLSSQPCPPPTPTPSLSVSVVTKWDFCYEHQNKGSIPNFLYAWLNMTKKTPTKCNLGQGRLTS